MTDPEMLPPNGEPTTFLGGPCDGEPVLVPGGLPPAKIMSGWDATGYYERVDDRYVWREGKPAL